MDESTIENTVELYNSCRLCLSQNEEISIFDNYRNSIQYAEIAMSLSNIKITSNDKLPKNICLNCCCKLESFYKFKQNCESSHCTLMALFDIVSDDNKQTYSQTEESEWINDIHPNSDNNIQIKIGENDLSEIHENPNVPAKNYEECVKKSKSKVKRNETNVHVCQQCGKNFQRKSTLIQHFITHSSEKKFSCDICQKKFTRKNQVAIHMRGHHNIKPCVCDICSRGFTKSSDLSRHKKVHSDRKDYICEVCGKAFKRSTDLTSHMNSHTGHRPYHCKKCEKAYTSHSSMMKHCRKHDHL